VVNETKRNREQQRRRRSDFRVICDCQRHRRSASAFWRIASRGAAVLVSLPLAFAALDLPISAMSLKVVDGEFFQAPKTSSANVLPMFTTAKMRDEFLRPGRAPRSLTIDLFKEAYFREHVPYGDIIFREARRNDLPPELVAAMVHTESDFRPGLISNKRAQGLMQIVPSTARLLGINDPFDPQQNIAAGTKYFRYLLNRFDNETMALAAYNAGEGNVVRFGGIPPFPETRDYIVKVNRRTDRYRQRVHNTYLAMVRVRNADLAQ
jgi:soluble lytic murein transglycosylase-like protein